jgi:mono/diheme cytochrome c family protein
MMRAFFVSLSASALLLILGGGVFLYSGLFNVAATDKHSPAVHWLLEQTRLRSIKTHAAGIHAPAGLDYPEKVLAGSDHFAAHCAICHGAPGVPKGDIGQGLYPEPPNLAQAAGRYSPTELFWILKNGIKMTGMPAWNDHDDEELWAVVAFLEKLPGMTEQDYAGLVMANMMKGTHHHH